MIARVSQTLSRACVAFAALGLVGMTLIIGWQVFARYVLNAAPAWSEQAALVLMIYVVLFAAAAGVHEGFHIRLSMLADALPGPLATACTVAAHLVVAMFGAALVVFGAELVAATWAHASPTLGSFPRGAAYLPIPLAGALMSFFALEHAVTRLRSRRSQG